MQLNINQKDAVLIQQMLQSHQNKSDYKAVIDRLSNKPGMNFNLESFINDSTDYNKLR